MAKRRVYGPVPSRRFGLSLGVDLVPKKTCCYDCVYCQLGKTIELTVERTDFYPVGDVLADVGAALDTGPRPDVITLAGSGDPSLYRSLGRLIDGLHELGDIPVVFLTNGALLFKKEVARDALRADILAPSLDAGDQETFQKINRPHRSIGFSEMLRGLQAVCGKHPGKVRLEVMLVGGQNDSDEDIQRIAGRLGSIRADSIDINTPVRPGPGGRAVVSEKERLEAAVRAFGPAARIVADYRGPRAPGGAADAERRILDMLSRRPCTVEDIQSSLGIHPNEAIKMLDKAVKAGKVQIRKGEGQTYYFTSGS
jgi:wyosine [tRNA(Phe)-imidazoG37] synthetase (radical SAM superfamily)